MWQKKEPTSLGVYIDNHQIRVVALSWRNNSFYLSGVATEQLTAKTNLSSVLNKAVQAACPKARNIVLSIPFNQTLKNNLNLNQKIPNIEIEAQIKLMLTEQHVDKKLFFDFQQNHAANDENENIELDIIACQQNEITERELLLKKSKYNCQVIDVDALAIARFLYFTYTDIELIAVININSDSLSLHLTKTGKVLYSQTQDRHTETTNLAQSIARILQSINTADALYIIGIEDIHPELLEQIQQLASIQVLTPKLPAKLTISSHLKHRDLERNLSLFIPALGLAMHCQPKNHFINLKPWRAQQRTKKSKQRYVLLIICFLSGLVPISASSLFLAKNTESETALKSISFNQLKKDQKVLKQKHAQLHRIELKQKQILKLLNDVTKHVPEDIYYQSLKYQNNSIYIQGKSSQMSSINKLQSNLKRLSYLKKSLIKQVTEKQSSKIFLLKAEVNQKPVKANK